MDYPADDLAEFELATSVDGKVAWGAVSHGRRATLTNLRRPCSTMVCLGMCVAVHLSKHGLTTRKGIHRPEYPVPPSHD